mmetsp:Transcript_19685/g.22288  ORF Transcript_19685/g.22288 Transcript_19685/m.22288 type:complete len:237 (-) Transcript_19685:64-774(-)
MYKSLLISLCVAGTTTAFSTPFTAKTSSAFLLKSTTQDNSVPFFVENTPSNDQTEEKTPPSVSAVATLEKVSTPTPVSKKSAPAATTPKPNTRKVKKPNHKEGVFSPIVFASKKLVGDENINKLRAKIISLHAGVIGDFVDTHQTKIGSKIAKSLFVVMDSNKDGTLDKEELKAAFGALGFTWLKDKQVGGILQRADKDKNGVIDYEEFKGELAKTLRVNLVKLAKKNGEDMGFLV